MTVKVNRVELDEIRQLSSWLQSSGFSCLEFSRAGERIKLNVSGRPQPPIVVAEGTAAPLAPGAPEGDGHTVALTGSAGVFVAAHPLRSQPFVAVGDAVRKDDVLGLLKIGQVYAPVIAPVDGVVTRIIAVDGALLDFAAPVLVLSPANHKGVD